MWTSLLALEGAQDHSAVDRGFTRQAQMACIAPIGKRPLIKGIRIENVAAAAGDLPKLRITDTSSGGWLLAYYDPVSEKVAYARAACLGAQLRLLNVELGGAWPRQQWSSVVFTTEQHYAAPASGRIVRWSIPVESQNALGAKGQSMIALTMPHEQVHYFQGRSGASLPRWVVEGHAEWVSRRIKQRLTPMAAKVDAARYDAALQACRQPVALSEWGSMRFKRDAVMRQMPPEERRKMEADPKYTPSLQGRSFKIDAADMLSDESNVEARYEASWRVFRRLEAAHGEATVRNWMERLTARSGRIDAAEVNRNATAVFHEDVGALLP